MNIISCPNYFKFCNEASNVVQVFFDIFTKKK